MSSSRRQRVLIVEDERLLADAMSTALGRYYDVSQAGSVAAAHRFLAGAQFDVVLCDVRLPDGTVQDVRAIVGDAGPKFVIITGGDASAAREANGGAPVVIKPFDVDELLAVLAELLTP
ncbi:MAG: response regulator [Kofleriaceae bacterium]|nr:response regulator [Kofleriaceae bacterium]